VHAHTSWLDGYAASAVKHAFGVPMVLTEHSGPFSTQVENAFRRRATRSALRSADVVLAVSSFLRAQMVSALPDLAPLEIDVLGNGVDPDRFPLAPLRRSGEPVRAVWIGSFLPIKQPLMLLQAFAAARDACPGLELHLIGNGPLEKDMRALSARLGIASCVTWWGSLPRGEVSLRIREADFLVVSSRAETFSVATLEALVSGRPVLTTRCGGPEEIVDEPGLGLVVANDEAALASGLSRMAASCRQANPARLRASAISRYSHDAIARRLVSHYTSILSRKAA
jgi:glycosyltransferase involved in cell wall biosynthesis